MRAISSLYLVIFFTLLFSACVNGGNSSTAPPSAIPRPTFTVQSLATPYALQPAAGICATSTGKVVLIVLNADIPAPRCASVTADQTLSIMNKTQTDLMVSFGGVLNTLLSPGSVANIDTPFGDYLAPGVHQIHVDPCCGAEIWLERK